MKLKLFVILIVALGYLAVTFACSSTSNSVSNSAPGGIHSKQNTNPRANSNTAPPMMDGVDPPHAVDISGKPIPASSTTMPDKPIILAKDSESPIRGELKPEAAFDHDKHFTDLRHTLDGKTLTACIECHHTEQPSAPKGKEYLTRFERKEELIKAKQLEDSKQPVNSCRFCHFQEGWEGTTPFPSVTYPREMKKQPIAKVNNEEAYHINCRSCHEAAKKRDPSVKAPQTCVDCHSRKQ